MEDFNEDDEVWSNPVTDTLKISNSEQVVRGITMLNSYRLTSLSLTICVIWSHVYLAWLFILVSISIMYLLTLLDEGFACPLFRR